MNSGRLKLSILDQSIVRRGGTAQALAETIETAKLAERLGYPPRFWVSEHHNSTMIAGSAPELLMVKLADETSTIRIGSGGVMLPNRALKVAENFRLLETLFPGRIDLGIGRAPGGDRVTAALLNPSNNFSEEGYLRQIEHLQAYFRDEAGTQYGPLLAVPQSAGIPEQWILSSSVGGSSLIAAKYGLGLAIARFISAGAGPEMAEQYRRDFQPSEGFPEPRVLLAISVLCAETEERAAQLRKLADLNLLKFEQGRFEPMGPYEEIADYEFSPEELVRIHYNRGRIVSGTPETVKAQLSVLAEEFGAEEIVVTTMTYAQEDRWRGFELLAKVFTLMQQS